LHACRSTLEDPLNFLEQGGSVWTFKLFK
jgi:hypothetical protein